VRVTGFLEKAGGGSLDGGKVEEKLKRSAIVADVECGNAISTIIMAKAYLIANLLDLTTISLLLK
jgi:hypothetical protein